MPRFMGPEDRPVRGGKSPRSLAVKATGVTDQNLPSEMSAAKKAAARKKKSAVDKCSRIDLILLSKSLGFAS